MIEAAAEERRRIEAGKREEKPALSKEDPDQKDLFHVVINAVEENWLKQAPQPTYDVSTSSSVGVRRESGGHPDSDDGSDCRHSSAIEAAAAAAGGGGGGDDSDLTQSLFLNEGSQGMMELPYLETTLPQERVGTVTITPVHQRISDCKLTSVRRPRSSSPRSPGNLNDFSSKKKKEEEDAAMAKITITLPGNEIPNRPKPQPESWEVFTAKGMHSFKGKSCTAESTESSKSMNSWINCEHE